MTFNSNVKNASDSSPRNLSTQIPCDVDKFSEFGGVDRVANLCLSKRTAAVDRALNVRVDVYDEWRRTNDGRGRAKGHAIQCHSNADLGRK